MAVKFQLHVIISLFYFISLWNLFIVYVNGYENPAPCYIGDVAINCGCHGNSTALDGRPWFGDEGTRSAISRLQPRGKSTSSTADHRSLSADPIPYISARISTTEFYYAFQVNPGQKFIRLHFHPSAYRGFEKSQDFFNVNAGPFTLLRNFSASLAAEALGVKYLVKEYCLNIEEDKYLNLTFYPSQSSKQRNIYAFVNGIEIIAMPTGLYYTPHGNLGARIVDQSSQHYYYIDNGTALEMVQRLNVGGSSISPVEDIGMFRRWSEDHKYLLTSELLPVSHLVYGVKFTSIPAFTAAFKIYQTSWRIRKIGRADEMHNFTWKIPVDSGFRYLVRLHFCNFELEMTEGDRRRESSVLINNQVAENMADLIRLSGGTGVPMYRDYMVMVKGKKEASKCDLLIALQSTDELVVGLLHGLEIFKLSNLENNLASPSAALLKQVSTSWNLKIQTLPLAFGKMNSIATVFTALLVLLNLAVFKLRQIWQETCQEGKDTRYASSRSCNRFSLAEIISATQNFNDSFLIGRGGFGNVYKGFLRGGLEIVAVKRLNPSSKQGAHEFWTEIETLSKIRHTHLVSLIGYCKEYEEMILVYEYMPRGTLADNLYKIDRNGNDCSPLTWEQRLRICIDAARGLDYLHTGVEFGVIHRDVKDSNILLDENLVAKISDFGLSKLGKVSESQGTISTKVKGTRGYLDPDYFITHKPTRKTDVYAFGVVMLVVLCGRPAIDKRNPWEPQSLLSLFRECMTKGDIDDIIDPSLLGKSSFESLKEFIKSVENCVHSQPKQRPTMSQMVTSLEYALDLQERTKSSRSEEEAIYGHPSNGGVIQENNEFSVSLKHQESAISSPEEGITNKVIGNLESQPRQEGFQSMNKPVWFWPREALRKMRKKKLVLLPEEYGLISSFTISEIKDATENFSQDLLIRYGASDPVYKGRLPNGREIAVKRLSGSSWRTTEPFMDEIRALSKLEHTNIVQLLGFCCKGEEKILIHEFVPNKSLEYFFFDPEKKPMLDWPRRQKIIKGIARGLLYLHDDSGVRIIHGNLKASKILLDKNMNPKIADFGSARILGVDQSEVHSVRIEKTSLHRMPPEFLTSKRSSVKLDVYCFGLLILEIIRGTTITNSNQDSDGNLIAFAWRDWSRRIPLDLLDPDMDESYDKNEVIKYINVALLCIQHVEQRPTMALVIHMLNNTSSALPAPPEPLQVV